MQSEKNIIDQLDTFIIGAETMHLRGKLYLRQDNGKLTDAHREELSRGLMDFLRPLRSFVDLFLDQSLQHPNTHAAMMIESLKSLENEVASWQGARKDCQEWVNDIDDFRDKARQIERMIKRGNQVTYPGMGEVVITVNDSGWWRRLSEFVAVVSIVLAFGFGIRAFKGRK